MKYQKDLLGIVFTQEKMILIGFLSKTNSEVYKIIPILESEIDNLFILNLTKILNRIEKFILKYNLLESDAIIVLDGGLLQESLVLNFINSNINKDNIQKSIDLNFEKFKEKFHNYIWSESELSPEIFKRFLSNSNLLLNQAWSIYYISGIPHYIQFQYYLIALKLSLNLIGISTLFAACFKTLEFFFLDNSKNNFEMNFFKKHCLFNLKEANLVVDLEKSVDIDSFENFEYLEVNKFKFYIEKIIKHNNYFQANSNELFYKKGLFLLRDL